MEITSLSSKGQIVIPRKIREALRAKPGMKFLVNLEGEKIVLEPVQEDVIARLSGVCRGLDLLKDLEEEHHKEKERKTGSEI